MSWLQLQQAPLVQSLLQTHIHARMLVKSPGQYKHPAFHLALLFQHNHHTSPGVPAALNVLMSCRLAKRKAAQP
jgi:hypothetical protein